MSQTSSQHRRFELRTFPQLLAASMLTRLMVDTTSQLFNPFLPNIAAGTGVSLVDMGRLVSLRSAMGLFSPIFGSLADRVGFRRIMRAALLLGAAGMFVIGLSQGIAALAAGMVLSGLGLSVFVPTLQAYMSARLPYHRRAQGIGILEYSWALASIVGLVSLGVLIDRAGWRAPFFVLGGGLVLGWVLFGFFPAAREDQAERPAPAPFNWRTVLPRLRNFFRFGAASPSVYAVIAANALIFFAQFHILIIHGGWLKLEYGLSASALGVIALIQGVADLCGSVLVSLITDRIGKKRAVAAGMAAVTLVYALLPVANVGLLPVVIALALMRFSFEYAIVSNIILISEQAPTQRGKVMSLAAAVNLSGATISGFSGPWAYERFGVWGLGPVSAVCTALGLLILLRWVHDHGNVHEEAPSH